MKEADYKYKACGQENIVAALNIKIYIYMATLPSFYRF